MALEAEPLLRMFLADQGTRDDALATLAAARAWAEERNEGNLTAARAFLAGGGEFDARAAPTMLVGAFLTDFYKLVADWADWAGEQVADWPDDPAGRRLTCGTACHRGPCRVERALAQEVQRVEISLIGETSQARATSLTRDSSAGTIRSVGPQASPVDRTAQRREHHCTEHIEDRDDAGGLGPP